ncbi:hypothetical protein ASD45_10815 [Pseudolabrys sp. Root1462]|jgi:hypothetical protein|uniref:hypothetical protein n=1 Tax=Pseudolabrys sp. Root1462 TaxID=1736466 RepID=UPI000702B377|nr:hypothetical protein [Pseudolabrys sp. Root1462]KQZ01288.1 hypothetical protein ASD45_10815 [Pseudolabrys sp. Root1462]
MVDLVTEDDIERARNDPGFRQELLAKNLEQLLAALNTMRRNNGDRDPLGAKQIREGVDLAVQLAGRLQKAP